MSDSAESRSHPILGDPRAVSWVGRKSGTKVFKYVHENFRPAFSQDPTAPRSPRMKSPSFFTQKLCNISLAYPRSSTSQKGSCILPSHMCSLEQSECRKTLWHQNGVMSSDVTLQKTKALSCVLQLRYSSEGAAFHYQAYGDKFHK